MPTIRRKSRTAQPPGLTDDQREFLLYGRNLLTGDFPFKNERHRKELYFQHQEELLEAVGPDKRPAAWWNFESPERRRVIAGDESVADYSKGLSFGRAKIYNIESLADLPKYESQADYLKRLNLYEET